MPGCVCQRICSKSLRTRLSRKPLTFDCGSTLRHLPRESQFDLSEVRGQANRARALEIAAAGQHSLLLIGPPGTGKSMLAQRLPGLLPPMSEAKRSRLPRFAASAVRRSDSRSGACGRFAAASHRLRDRTGRRRRAAAAGRNLAGAQRRAVPRRAARVRTARARSAARTARERLHHRLARRAAGRISRELPADRGDESLSVRLSGRSARAAVAARATRSRRYRARISGPLLDRLDMHVEVPRVPTEPSYGSDADGESSATVAARVHCARELQIARQGKTNARLRNREMERTAAISARRQHAGARHDRAGSVSARASSGPEGGANDCGSRRLRDEIGAAQVSEAIALRRFDRAGRAAQWRRCLRQADEAYF